MILDQQIIQQLLEYLLYAVLQVGPVKEIALYGVTSAFRLKCTEAMRVLCMPKQDGPVLLVRVFFPHWD
jgi:hypothetical protein